MGIKFSKVNSLTIKDLAEYPDDHCFKLYLWNKPKYIYVKLNTLKDSFICTAVNNPDAIFILKKNKINLEFKITLDPNYEKYLKLNSLTVEDINRLSLKSEFICCRLYTLSKPKVYTKVYLESWQIFQPIPPTSNKRLIFNKSKNKLETLNYSSHELGKTWKLQLTSNCLKYLKLTGIQYRDCYTTFNLLISTYKKSGSLVYVIYSEDDKLFARKLKNKILYKYKMFKFI